MQERVGKRPMWKMGIKGAGERQKNLMRRSKKICDELEMIPSDLRAGAYCIQATLILCHLKHSSVTFEHIKLTVVF